MKESSLKSTNKHGKMNAKKQLEEELIGLTESNIHNFKMK